jgi:ribose transport system substrate-binding protein
MKDAQNDSLRQRSQVEEFVNQRVDVLIVSPKEAVPLTPPVVEAHRKGIPVIVLDRKIASEEYRCFIGADNREIGRAAGQWIRTRLNGKGRVVELKGLMTSTLARTAISGFERQSKQPD